MKNTIKILTLMLAGGALASCDNFLKDDSGDLLVPRRVGDYQPLLYGEGYPNRFSMDLDWFVLMTDDVEMSLLGDTDLKDAPDRLTMGEGRMAYTWDMNMEQSLPDEFWDARYKNIMCCNLVINNIGNIEYTEGEVGKFNYLIAQAYTLRAYNYFCLVNTYALPWSEENLGKPGVVIRLEADLKEGTLHKSRSTIGQVYELIESDLALAGEYMQKSVYSASKHLIRPVALKFLENRVALFRQQWDKVISTGTEFLKMNNTIYNMASLADANLGKTEYTGTNFALLDPAVNDEIIFTFGNNPQYAYLSKLDGYAYGFTTSRSNATGVENDDEQAQRSLMAMYSTNDKRRLAFFATAPEKQFYPVKYLGKAGITGYRECWRTVEVMLNMAEAYARTSEGVSAEGLTLFNDLRAKRIKSYKAVTAATLTKESLLRRILSERRRELCFEEAMRFWDLRRQGMPSITHKWFTSKSTWESYVLPAGSPNYVLPIPKTEAPYNNEIINNERENITPQ